MKTKFYANIHTVTTNVQKADKLISLVTSLQELAMTTLPWKESMHTMEWVTATAIIFLSSRHALSMNC
ncbi:hypothetical protein DPMN_029938 [Dreissena polymorpha]|uniref:Uncharacterized protein n=1 Tax=Dreissena polymorpha TaxID=45954 RepID=A0A9D4LZ18_DREPO|nr:hypothetical protein DPMN_029938 [Dreissena polymorpha]